MVIHKSVTELVNTAFFRNFGLLIASVLIAVQSVFFVTQSGALKVAIANEKINEVTQYRAPELNPGEYVNYLYLKDGRLYSTDVNINGVCSSSLQHNKL